MLVGSLIVCGKSIEGCLVVQVKVLVEVQVDGKYWLRKCGGRASMKATRGTTWKSSEFRAATS